MTTWVDIAKIVGGALSGLLVYLGGRTAVRSSRRAAIENRDAQWVADYRSGAERHLAWDGLALSSVRELRSEVNQLREAAGKPPKEWIELPEAPALFPRSDRKDDAA